MERWREWIKAAVLKTAGSGLPVPWVRIPHAPPYAPPLGRYAYIMPSDVEFAWAAGVVDADGCVTMRPPSGGSFRHPFVVVDSTDLEILQELASLFGGRIVSKKSRDPRHRPQWSWRLYGARNVLAFLGDIVEYMRCPSKAGRARLLLDEYPSLTPRNGRYSADQRIAKYDMEDRFMAIGHGRGASLRALGRAS
jgi:hypothetical protein